MFVRFYLALLLALHQDLFGGTPEVPACLEALFAGLTPQAAEEIIREISKPTFSASANANKNLSIRLDDLIEAEIAEIAKSLNLSSQEVGVISLRLYVLLHKRVGLSKFKNNLKPSYQVPKDELLNYLLSNAVTPTKDKSTIYIRAPQSLKNAWSAKMSSLALSENDGAAHVIQYFGNSVGTPQGQALRERIAEAFRTSKARELYDDNKGIYVRISPEIKEHFETIKKAVVDYYLERKFIQYSHQLKISDRDLGVTLLEFALPFLDRDATDLK